MTIIGRNLKDYRLNLGYSQDQIAKYLGVDRSTISHYETGDRDASLVHLSKLADLFGIELEDFSEPDAVNKAVKLAFAFRKEGFYDQDLESIASFQRIVKNYIKMNEMLKNDE